MYRPVDIGGAAGRPVNGQAVHGYQAQLGLTGDPKIVRVPHDGNHTVNDPLSSIPADHRHGFTNQELNTPLGQVMGMRPDQLDGSRLHDHVALAGGGGYNHDTNTTLMDNRLDDRTLYHELGHQQQNEHGLNATNTDPMVLEYHNIAHNENNLPGGGDPRTDYTLANGSGRYPQQNQTWDSMRNDVNTNPNFPDAHRPGTNTALDQLEQSNSGSAADRLLRQNLVTEYYRKHPTP